MAGTVPKQYLEVAGKCILEHSLGSLLACDAIERVIVALHPQDSRAASLAALADTRVERVAGGAQRSDSVLAALQHLSASAAPQDWVLVHDAARPCLRLPDLERLIEEVTTSGIGGVLAEPVVDTIKLADNEGLVERTVDRSRLWRAQTPQMFRLGPLREALLQAAREGLAVTDEASAMEAAGHPVQLVAGSSSNLKVTVPEDLALARFYLQQTTGGGLQ
jgi:2-C-methyl-D-erythritol 4-phosphate cytidylyltransferase